MTKNNFTFGVLVAVFLATPCPQKASADPTGNWGEDLSQKVKDPNSILEESKEGMWLVKARCLSVTPDDTKIARWQIDTVFNGPQTLKDKSFVVGHQRTHSNAISSQGVSLPFAPDVNEEALWVVQLEQEQVRISSFWSGHLMRTAYGIAIATAQNHLLPEGYRGFPDYSDALLQAKAVELVAKAEPREQIRLLKEYARSSSSVKSAWAIATLSQSDDDSIPPFLLGLTDEPQLPISGFLVLDKVLDSLDWEQKVKWSRTPKRFELWKSLVSSSANDYEGKAIISDLHQIALNEKSQRDDAAKGNQTYDPSIGEERVFQWLRLGADNAKWAPSTRSASLASTGRLNQATRIPRATLWNFLLLYVEAHPDFTDPTKTPANLKENEIKSQLAEGALRGIRQLAPFTESEVAKLRLLQTQAKSPNLKSNLRRLLREK